MRRLMKYTAVVLATWLALIVLWQFRLVLLLFVLSLFTAAAIRPFVGWLTRRGLPKTAAQLLLYVGVAGFLLLFLLLIGNRLLLELNTAVNQAVIEYEALYRAWEAGSSWQQAAVSVLPPPFTSAAAQSVEMEEMLPVVVRAARTLTGLVGGLVLILALSVYWSADQVRFERLWLSLLPATHRTYARDSWRQIETAVGGYLRSQAAQSVLAALLLGGGAWLGGVSYPFLCAFVGALAAIIPLFGGLVMVALAFVVGSLSSTGVAVGAAVYTLCVYLLLEFIVEPKLWQRERRGFLLTFLVLIPLVESVGIWGLFIAPPLAAALEVVITQAYQISVRRPKTAVALGDLETRYQQILDRLAHAGDEGVSPELANLTHRLATLLHRSRDAKTAETV